MNAIEAILTRRSIRAYTGEEISEEQLRTLLQAGMSGPSAMNRRPFAFVVVRDKEKLAAVEKFHPYAKMLAHASVGIFVCGTDLPNMPQGYFQQDCAAATENILIAAHALGLGAVWIGVYPRADRVDGVRALLGLPEDVQPFCIISVGYPAEKRDAPDRYESWRVHREKW